MYPILYVVSSVVATALVVFLLGIRIVRPTHRGLVERFGKYSRFADPGFSWIIPLIDRMIQVNITEQMVDAQPQEIITNDNLNARVDAQVWNASRTIETTLTRRKPTSMPSRLRLCEKLNPIHNKEKSPCSIPLSAASPG